MDGQTYNLQPARGERMSPARLVLILLVAIVIAAAGVLGVRTLTHHRGPAAVDVVYQVDPTLSVPAPLASSAASVLEFRLLKIGVTDYSVAVEQENRIHIVVYGLPRNVTAAGIRRLLVQTGRLTFVLLPKDQYGTGQIVGPDTGNIAATVGPKQIPAEGTLIDPALPAQFSGDDLDKGAIAAQLMAGSQVQWQIAFAFRGDKAKEFESWTGEHVGETLAIVVDGKVVSAPIIQGAVTGGSGIITGNFTQASAEEMAAILNGNPLPCLLTEVGGPDSSPSTT